MTPLSHIIPRSGIDASACRVAMWCSDVEEQTAGTLGEIYGAVAETPRLARAIIAEGSAEIDKGRTAYRSDAPRKYLISHRGIDCAPHAMRFLDQRQDGSFRRADYFLMASHSQHGLLMLRCSPTGTDINTGVHMTPDQLANLQSKAIRRLHCPVCYQTHEFVFSTAWLRPVERSQDR